MMAGTKRPSWITFDCYGTLIQWDEGLLAATSRLLAARDAALDPHRLIAAYDTHEHHLERRHPDWRFARVCGTALRLALAEFDLPFGEADAASLIASIAAMPPFPEVVGVLEALKRRGFQLCVISNTDDAIIAGNVRQLGGLIDCVVTAQQAGAYKPSRRIFDFAHRVIGVEPRDVVHVCASPHLDLAAARDLGFRAVWIDRGTGRRPPDGYEPDAIYPTLEGVPILFDDLGWT